VAQDFFGVAEATPCHPDRTATAVQAAQATKSIVALFQRLQET